MPTYDFLSRRGWSPERIKSERLIITNKIKSLMLNSDEKVASGWIVLFHLLPSSMKEIIIFEISNGNEITRIGKASWPSPESIVVNLLNRFHPTSRTLSEDTHWRLLNDARYCREEISESDGSTVHLIIV